MTIDATVYRATKKYKSKFWREDQELTGKSTGKRGKIFFYPPAKRGRRKIVGIIQLLA